MWEPSPHLQGELGLNDYNWTPTLNHRVWIHSETRTWHDKNIQSNAPYRQILTIQLNHLVSLAKWLSVRIRTKWSWVRVLLQLFLPSNLTVISLKMKVLFGKMEYNFLSLLHTKQKENSFIQNWLGH